MTIPHLIIAAPWQLTHDLKAIILPIEKYYNYPVTKVQHNGLGTAIYSEDFLMGFVENLFAVGDRIYLQEEWNQPNSTSLAIPKSRVQPGSVAEKKWDWRSAETMPIKAAQYWFEITGVRVCQAKDLTTKLLVAARLIDSQAPESKHQTVVEPLDVRIDNPNLLAHAAQAIKNVQCATKWNPAYPGYRWHADLWGVVLEVKTKSPS